MLRLLGALSAGESLLGMDSTFVGSEVTCAVKCHWTFLTIGWVDVLTRKGLLLQMHAHDMFLKGRVFPERLVTRRKFRAAKLVSSIMGSYVSTKS